MIDWKEATEKPPEWQLVDSMNGVKLWDAAGVYVVECGGHQQGYGEDWNAAQASYLRKAEEADRG